MAYSHSHYFILSFISLFFFVSLLPLLQHTLSSYSWLLVSWSERRRRSERSTYSIMFPLYLIFFGVLSDWITKGSVPFCSRYILSDWFLLFFYLIDWFFDLIGWFFVLFDWFWLLPFALSVFSPLFPFGQWNHPFRSIEFHLFKYFSPFLILYILEDVTVSWVLHLFYRFLLCFLSSFVQVN